MMMGGFPILSKEDLSEFTEKVRAVAFKTT